MANSTIITRKIGVYIHRHGDDDEAKQRLDYEYKLWRDINDNLYKAANRIMSHCFFNDAYEYRLKIQSPRLQEIDKALRYSKRDKLESKDIAALKAERKLLFDEFKKQRQTFLRGGISEGANPEQNSTYKVVSHEFLDTIPSHVLTCLNQNIASDYKKYTKEIEYGKRSIPNYKKGLPVPFPIKDKGELMLKKRRKL